MFRGCSGSLRDERVLGPCTPRQGRALRAGDVVSLSCMSGPSARAVSPATRAASSRGRCGENRCARRFSRPVCAPGLWPHSPEAALLPRRARPSPRGFALPPAERTPRARRPGSGRGRRALLLQPRGRLPGHCWRGDVRRGGPAQAAPGWKEQG